MDVTNMLAQGTMLRGGTYRIEKHIASGGFGNTYLVRNVSFDEVYAMKEFFMKGINLRNGQEVTVSVPANHDPYQAQMEKFRKEALRLRKLHNPHIVQVHDLFEENGTVYYVMDYIDGESLSSRIKRTGKPLTEEEIRRMMPQILQALETVHNEKIWHLDIKPGNIMIDKKDNAFLIDFGASKQLHSKDGASVATSSALCYTPGYAPMEQVEQAIDKFGPWTDFYALGATFYYCLTRNQPPSFTSLSESDALIFPSGISEQMVQLIVWMMRPNRKDRPKSVAEIQQFLEKKPESPSAPKKVGEAVVSEETQLVGAAAKSQSAGAAAAKSQSAGAAAATSKSAGAVATSKSAGTENSKQSEPPKNAAASVPGYVDVDDDDDDDDGGKRRSGGMPTWLLFIIIFIVTAGVGGGAYYLLDKNNVFKSSSVDDDDEEDYQDIYDSKYKKLSEKLFAVDDIYDIEAFEEEYDDLVLYDINHDEVIGYSEDLLERINNKRDSIAYANNYIDIQEIKLTNEDNNSTVLDGEDDPKYASRIQYLTPCIYYKPYGASALSATFTVKVTDDEGNIIDGTSSPAGYSYNSSVTLEGYNHAYPNSIYVVKLLGWGNADGGIYKEGKTYTFTVYHDGYYLGSTTVSVY